MDINKIYDLMLKFVNTDDYLEKKLYVKEYILYRKLFTEYIIEKLGLKQYDDEIGNSGLNMKPVDEKDMDMYQFFSSNYLKYFYIRNNIYIERLNSNDRMFLQERIKNNNFELDFLAKRFIEKTYKVIVIEETLNLGEKKFYAYGPNTTTFMAPSNAIVIGMRYDEFAEHNLSDEEWKNQHDDQTFFIYPMFDRMMVLLEDEVDMPVSVIKYTTYSVKKMLDYIEEEGEKN